MKKYLAVCTILFGLLPLGVVAQDKTVSIALYDYYPFLLKNSHEKGYAYDLAKAALRESGYAITTDFMPLIRAAIETSRGQYDAILGLNPSHTSEIVFSKTPITALKFIIWARKDMNWIYDSIDSVKSVQLITISGFDYASADKAYQDYINTRPQNVSVLYGEDAIQRAFVMIDKNRADIFALDIDQATEILNQLEMTDRFKSVGELKNLYYGYFGVSRNHPEKTTLIEAFEKGMAKIRGDGELTRIIQKNVTRFGLKHVPLK